MSWQEDLLELKNKKESPKEDSNNIDGKANKN